MKQFKRIISFVIALTMLVSMFSVGIVNASAETQTYILGDVNQDGTVNVMDATLIQRHSARMSNSEIAEGTIEFAAADVNCDGKVTVMDATLIQRYAAQYDVSDYDIGKEFTFGEPDDPDDPSTDDPSTDDPSTDEPSTDEPSTDEPSTDEPSTDEPSTDEPSTDEPSTDEPSTDEPSTDEPSTDEPSTDEPSTEEPEEVTAGYYLVGTLNGESLWNNAPLTVDRKLKANPAVDGEYMLDWTFYGGDELKVVYYDGTEIKTWYNDGGDNYKIGETSNKVGPGTIYFNPDGNSEWSYKYFTVQPKGDEPTEEPSTEEPSTEEVSSDDESSEAASTEEPSTDDPSTDEPSTEEPDEVTAGYYLVGALNGEDFWGADTITADRMLKANPAVDGEYMLDWTFYGGDEIKVVYFDGTEIKTWYNDGGDNYKIGATSNKVGPGTIYFNPDGNSEWSYKYFTVQPKGDEPTEEPSTEEPSTEEVSSDDESSEDASTEDASTDEPSTDEPDEVTAGYYLVGTLNGESLWNNAPLTADRKFVENPAVDGEYMLDWTFYGGDELKVVYYDGTEIKTWYKDQADNYKIGETSDKVGNCTIYFNPDGNSEWSYKYFTVQPKGDEPTDEPSTEEPSTEEPSTEEPSTEEVSSDDESSEAASTEEPSTDEPSTDEPSTEEPSTEDSETVAAGYYLVGTLNGENFWDADNITADRMLKANPAVDGEYMLDWTFYGGDEIKVVYFDGTEIKTWYNDGGDNYKIGATSNKVGPGTIYFNPDGNSEWSYKFFTVQPKGDEPTDEPSTEEPSTEEPSTEEVSSDDESSEDASTEEPSTDEPSTDEPDEVTAGYYLVGTLNGESLWNNAPLTADRKFVENPAVDGEYMLDWTFYGGDELKVVYFDGTEIKTWYNDGGDNYKIGATSNKVGPGTIYFNPDGNSEWSYKYFTVQPKGDEPTEEPSTEEPSTEEPSTEEPSTEEPSTEEPSTEEPSTEEPSTEEPSTEEPSTEEPSTEEPSTEDSETVAAGYYLVGTLNGENFWDADNITADRMLKANPAVDGEYMLDWTFYGGDEIKVVYFDGTEIKTWYNDGGDNYKIGATSNKVGPGTIYFNPDGNSEWSYKYFTVQPKGDEPTEEPSTEEPSTEEPSTEEPSTEEPSTEEPSTEEPSTEEPSTEEPSTEEPSTEEPSTEEPSTEEPSTEEPSTEDSETVAAGYYLVGTLNGEDFWDADNITADRMLKANPAVDGEYMLDWTFYGGDEIKVVYFDGTEIKTWYNDGGDNYKIGATSNKVGPGTIYFNPDGNSEWSYKFFTVQPKGDEPTEEPSTEEPSTEEPSTEEPSTEEPTEPVGYTVYFVNSGKWSKVNAYVWNPSGSAWPGSAMTKTGDVAPNGADVYSMTFTQNHGNIIFNDGSSQTSDLTFQAGKYYDFATSKWYDSLDDIPSAAPTGYTVYCVNSKNWSKINAYVWNPNGSAWPGSAMTKTGEKSSKGYDIYSITFTQNHGKVIFNNGSSQTADLDFKAGQYFDLSSGKWYADASTI